MGLTRREVALRAEWQLTTRDSILRHMSALRRKPPTVEQNITMVLEELGPLIRIEHTRIEIAEYSEVTGRLVLRMDGNCPDCELSPATFMPAIKAHLKQRVPQVREVSVIER